ncbi:MAG: DegQ family serine endoprotease [candidate division KSB1 bacterium]|nr:DegQ family serine endoprotease [candidate division KSB1 bacterium]
MSRINRRTWLLAMVFFLGFLGDFVVASNFGLTSGAVRNEKSAGSPQTETLSSEGRSVANQLSEAFEAAAGKVNQSIVPIFAEQVVEVQSPFGFPNDPFRDFFGDDFFKRFFGTPPQSEKQTVRSLGSGVIVTTDGYILTNNHVVAGADKLTVVLANKQKYAAKVIGTDPQTDVAVIKIDAKDLPAAILGNSDNVKVGQWVIAVGNPFQLMHTVTAGIISAKGRSEIGLADYEDFIQTDAAINPGNSGGALADLDGNVIGINTAINSPSGGNIGIGFAIPINMARRVMDALISKGKVTRGYMGLLLQDIDENLAKALKLKSTEGSLVGDVTPGGPADKAGIKRGDVIIKLDGNKIENSTQLRNIVAQTSPRTPVKVTLIRNGKEMELTVVLDERPQELRGTTPQERQPEEQSYEKLGLSVQTLTPDIANQLGYQNEQGVVVTDVAGGSPAEDAGLQQGDLIKEVNRVKVRTVPDFKSAVARLKSGDSAALFVRRGQNTFFVAIQIP